MLIVTLAMPDDLRGRHSAEMRLKQRGAGG
jgi:hypothetical protein